jgi:SAM-dependent methyltransferase
MTNWLKNKMPEKIPSLAAVLYTAVPARMFAAHYAAIAESISVQDGQTLLDVGTGPGLLPILVARRFPNAHIIGIDLSEKMVDIARKKAAGVANVEFRVMNAAALAFADNSLDMVISTGSMHHWKRPVAVFDEIYRCLRPGAEAWIYDGYGDVSDADIERGFRRLGGWFPPRWLARRILRIHGFTQTEYETTIRETLSQTAFRVCLLEPCGIMMRIRLRKD